jgi:hypothetical protein
VKDLDFDMTDDLKIPLGVNVPLASTTINIKDFSKKADSNLLVIHPDGKIDIKFTQENVLDLDITDLTNIPDQDLFNENLVANLPTANFKVDIENENLLSLGELSFEEGEFVFSVTSTYPDSTQINLALPGSTINGNPAVFNFMAKPNGQTQKTFSIKDFKLDLTDGGTKYNSLALDITITSDGAPVGTPVNIALKMQNAAIKQVSGDFKNQSFGLDNDSLDFPNFGLDEFSEGIHFNNPQIRLNIKNGFGIPFGVDFNITGIDKDSLPIDLNLPQYNIAGASSPGNIADEQVEITKANSSIVSFLGKVPQQIYFGGSLSTNPSGGVSTNFIDNQSKCSADLEAVFPLEFYVDNVKLQSEFEDVELASQDEVNIESMELFFLTENTLPLKADLELFFLDENKVKLDSLSLPILKGSIVDNQGLTTQASMHEFSVKLTKSQIDNIYKTKHLLFGGTLNASEGTNKVVQVLNQYGVNIKIGVKLEGELNK